MILALVSGDARDDSIDLVYDDLLQPVLLVEIGVQILLHRLPLLLILVHTFVVMLDFLKVNVSDQIFDLLERVATFFRASGYQGARLSALVGHVGAFAHSGGFVSESGRLDVLLLEVLQLVSDQNLDLICLGCLNGGHWEV